MSRRRNVVISSAAILIGVMLVLVPPDLQLRHRAGVLNVPQAERGDIERRDSHRCDAGAGAA